MNSNLFFLGGNARSDFRTKKFHSELKPFLPELKNVETNWVFAIEINQKNFINRELIFNSLRNLLTLNQEDLFEKKFSVKIPNTDFFCVFPRLGTKSPWSSKAYDILKTCNFQNINSIERGVIYRFTYSKFGKNNFSNFLNEKNRVNKSLINFLNNCYDKMVEEIHINQLPINLFNEKINKPLNSINIIEKNGFDNLRIANKNFGLALSERELKVFFEYFFHNQRNPTDAELMMFAQVNSEHCRHKIFNSSFVIDGKLQSETLFEMVKFTHRKTPNGTILAYSDNAAIIKGEIVNTLDHFLPIPCRYENRKELFHTVFKAETHNHPTAVCPFPGAATGVGGEIRDEAATGIGGKSRAGFSGFTVSSLDYSMPKHRPLRQSSPLEIMIKGPLGSADFNNEFGRPQLFGYFRSFLLSFDKTCWGFHKPIMLAGGIGIIKNSNINKKQLSSGDLLVVIGGPGMKIGIGGGSASSMNSGENDEYLDFNSVQRGNPEIQRRTQEVINSCALLKNNPILSIHDVGAGGLANAVPEILHSSGVGGEVDIDAIEIADHSMSPAEIWCNESQERYVLCISNKDLKFFNNICKREKCPFSVIATVSNEKNLIVSNKKNSCSKAVDISLDFLFESKIKNRKKVASFTTEFSKDIDYSEINLSDAVDKVLSDPTVGSKSFLITIGDRTVGGLTARDQMVGPFQTPVADNAMVLWDYEGFAGQVFSIGERSPIAIKNSAAASRMALGETITNLLSAYILKLEDIKLSANWMAACGTNNQDKLLFEGVKALTKELCPDISLSIPVGKDSLSMKTEWNDNLEFKSVISPVSLNLSAVAKTPDVRNSWEPTLNKNLDDSVLIYVDLSLNSRRMGGSVLSYVYKKFGGQPPDLESTDILRSFFDAISEIHNPLEKKDEITDKKSMTNSNDLVFAYHDISDGGLLACLCEMAFAARVGITINIDLLTIDPYSQDWGAYNIRPSQVSEKRDELTFKALFNEELGVVLQTTKRKRSALFDIFRKHNLGKFVFEIGTINSSDTLEIYRDAKCIFKKPRSLLQRSWSETSLKISALRDNPECVAEDEKSIGNSVSLEKSICIPNDLHKILLRNNQNENVSSITYNQKKGKKPKVAVLREQGVNGHIEMAAAFVMAGFEAWDVHMTDLFSKKISLCEFDGLAISGGFSYGDVFGAGKGWAQSILLNNFLKDEFHQFFENKKKFILGVCNGCQFLCELQPILSKNEIWPKFMANKSERFEARQSFVEVMDSNSLFFQNMKGLKIPIVVSHGQGRSIFPDFSDSDAFVNPVMRYIDFNGKVTENYPENPNGSIGGLTGFSSSDGRITALMPHPERCYRNVQFSWAPEIWNVYGDYSPWSQIFKNAFFWASNQ